VDEQGSGGSEGWGGKGRGNGGGLAGGVRGGQSVLSLSGEMREAGASWRGDAWFIEGQVADGFEGSLRDWAGGGV